MRYLLIILLLAVLMINGCNTNERVIGGDKDEHGCLGSAGYQWCPSNEKCQRMWEEYCEEFKDQFKSEFEVKDFKSCEKAGYPIMESYPRQCKSGENTYTELLEMPVEQGIYNE